MQQDRILRVLLSIYVKNGHCQISLEEAEVTRIHLDTFCAKLMPNKSSLVHKKRKCGLFKEAGSNRRNFPKYPRKDTSKP